MILVELGIEISSMFKIELTLGLEKLPLYGRLFSSAYGEFRLQQWGLLAQFCVFLARKHFGSEKNSGRILLACGHWQVAVGR